MTDVSTARPGQQTTRRSARGPARSKQIIRAAANLFHEAGFQNVSIDDIGSAVGLTGPAVYRHFKGKNDILAKALLSQVTIVEDIAVRAAERSGTAQERMVAFLDELGERAVSTDEPMLWRSERRHLEPTDAADFRAMFGRVLELTVKLLEDVRQDLAGGRAELLGFALLSMYAYTHDIRVGLAPARLQQVQRAIAHSIVHCDLPAPGPDAEPAPQMTEWMPAGRRERLIHASTGLFDERGFHDVRIDDIAKAAGMSVATLYQHFKGKNELLQAILERGAEGLLYTSAAALARVSSPAEALDVLVRTYTKGALGMHGRIMRILATELVYLSDEVRTQLRTVQREYVAEWIQAMCALRPELSSSDARALAHATIDVVTDLSQTRRVRSRPGIADELHALAMSMVLPTELGAD
ncbi:TetR/AcrR family transcriptional regulator [Streptomyces hirsutus]|uniref:TetR/AcrR family transcriptional regulator n=1 Tax=Streptomyces hirsutus TaxID=35620 RepID=UPI00343A24A5